MAAKSIIEISVEDGEFRAFYDLFKQYEEQLGSMPEGWDKVSGSVGDASAKMGNFAKSSMSTKDFMMVAAIQADAISRAMTRATGVQDKFNTKAKDGSIQMGKMSKFSKEMHKSIFGMGSILLKLGTVGVGGITSALGAVYGATSTVANQNLQARGLGLRIGETQAFEANFEKFGLGVSDLGTVANAQGDVTKWRGLMAAGITPQQIQNENPEELTYDFAKAASAKYKQWQAAGMPAASLAQAYGFTDFLSLQQLRAGSSRTDEEWQQAQRKEIDTAKKAEIDQGVADKASDIKAKIKSNWAEVLNTFNEQLAKASPEIGKLSDAAAAAATAFLKFIGPEAKSVLDTMQGPPVSREEAKTKPGLAGGLARFGYALRDLGTTEVIAPGKGSNYTGPLAEKATPLDKLLGMRKYSPSYFGDIEKGRRLPSGLLYAQMMTESGGNVNARSPVGAMGPFQFMPDTARKYGISDPFSMPQAAAGAGHMDADLLTRYHGDIRKALAAYNWGMGNVDKDVKAHGEQWEKHAPPETQKYIDKITKLMAKNSRDININISNSTPSRVAVSMNAAQY